MQHDKGLLVNTEFMCITQSLIALDPVHTTVSLKALNLRRITVSLVALNPIDITANTSQSVHSMHESLQYDHGVCMTAAVLVVTVVAGISAEANW